MMAFVMRRHGIKHITSDILQNLREFLKFAKKNPCKIYKQVI